jgi:hypothetical protein
MSGDQQRAAADARPENFVFSLAHFVHNNNQQIVVKELIDRGDKTFMARCVRELSGWSFACPVSAGSCRGVWRA